MEDTDPVRKMEELLSLIFDSRMRDVYTNDELEVFVNSNYKILGLKIKLDEISSENTFDEYVEMLDQKLYNF